MGIYARYMDRWERKLAMRDTNRVVRPFEWGTDWLHSLDFPSCPADANGNSAECVSRFATETLADSERFFSYEPVRDYCLEGNRLTFTSPARTRYPENNTAHALWFPAPKDHGRALVLLPQWNSDADGHVGLAKLLNRFGISALRMTMAYHAERMPAELQRADYHVSSNIGRTIHASRQSVVDARACLDWLEQQGYSRLGILGTSLGSCIAFIAAAHDPRVRAVAAVSPPFSAEVYWNVTLHAMRRELAALYDLPVEEMDKHIPRITLAASLPGFDSAPASNAYRRKPPSCLVIIPVINIEADNASAGIHLIARRESPNSIRFI